jgi:hypothetical protein
VLAVVLMRIIKKKMDIVMMIVKLLNGLTTDANTQTFVQLVAVQFGSVNKLPLTNRYMTSAIITDTV